MAYAPATGDLFYNSTFIGNRDPDTDYFSGSPTEVPVTPALSGDNDRPIGYDNSSSRVEFNISNSPTFLHLPEWYLSFYTSTAVLNGRVYAEGLNNNTTLQYTIQSISDGKINVVMRNTAGSYFISVTTPEIIFDGTPKLIEIEKFSDGDITITADGNTDTFSTGVTATSEEANTSTIGALVRTTVSRSTFGSVWDFNKNGIMIPINEGTGTDIKDSTGTSVGTLVDPSGTFWDYSVSTWTLVEDKPCDDSNLLLDDNNIALMDDNGSYLFGD